MARLPHYPNSAALSFFANAASEPLLRSLITSLPGASFVIKDRQGRYIAASDGAYQRYGLTSEAEILGRTDSDFITQAMADVYVNADRAVMESGEPQLGLIEYGFDANQLPEWLLTQKFPVFDKRHQVIGVLVMLQSYEGQRASLASHESIRQAIAYLEKHLDRQVPLEELAPQAGMSERHLQRKFQANFGMSVQEFAVYLRIQTAARALKQSAQSIAAISASVGFTDQSAFSRKFRKIFGVTPREYRLKP